MRCPGGTLGDMLLRPVSEDRAGRESTLLAPLSDWQAGQSDVGMRVNIMLMTTVVSTRGRSLKIPKCNQTSENDR